jgi:hypothetical protein
VKRFAATALILAWWTIPVSAGDVWIVQGSAAAATAPCTGVVWQSESLFVNRGGSPAELRLLHQSNEGTTTVRIVSIPPGESLSANASALRGDSVAPLAVAHLDVPAAVAVDSRLDLYGRELCLSGRPPNHTPYGHVALPVFRALIPAGEEQVHTGTDLALKPVRMNVAVYNAGGVTAAAEITLRWPFCSAAANVQQIAAIPPDAIVQVPIAAASPPCVANPFGPAWATYVTVRVDQPSLSFVSTIANGVDPDTNAGIRTGDR